MALTTIKINLQSAQFFQPKQVEDTDLYPQYDQQQGIKQPKVLHQLNCVPLANGVKSADIYAAGINPVVLDESGLATDLQLGPSTELTSIIDKNGNLWYLLIDKSSAGSVVTDFYTRSAATTSQFRKISSLLNSTRYEYNVQTVFQNRTLIAGLPTTTFHVANTNVPHPDAVGAASGTFYEVDLTASTITDYDLVNIGVLDDIQCVTSYQNYMLLFTRNRIYWSCPTDPYDFTPTDAGGGSSAIAEVRGDILAVLPSASGFIIYCRENCVVGRFTGSTAQPFAFEEIKGSSGLIMKGEEALLVKNETNQIHYAFLVGGLSVVTENDVSPVDDSLRRFVSSDFVETRVANSGRLTRDNAYSVLGAPDAKVKRMYSYGTKLFFIVEVASATTNRMYIYDVLDGSIGILYGNYIAVTPRLTQADAATNLFLQRKVSAVPEAFILMKLVTESPQEVSFEVLDFGTRSNIPVLTGDAANATAEFMVGDISISPDTTTIVQSVRLLGRLDRVVPDEGGDLSTSTTRVRVFGYSSFYGVNSLLEFEFNPVDNVYYGLIEGPDVRILVVGDYFYLTGMEVRIDRGIVI